MFGLGPMEILLLIGLLVVLFGASRAGRILGTGVRLKRRADQAKARWGGLLSLRGLLERLLR